MIIEILLLLFTNYLSGYFLYKIFFRETNKIERLFFPQGLSLFLTPLLFYLLYLLFGFDKSLFIFPFMIIFTFFISLKFKQKFQKFTFDKKVIFIFVVFMILFSFAIYRNYFYGFENLNDTANYISVSNNIRYIKNLPPEAPCFSGEKFNYQWFYHLTISLISIYLNVDVVYVYPIFTLYLLFLSLFISFITAKKYFNDNIISSVFSLIIVLVFAVYFYAPQTQSYALIILSLFFYSLISFIKFGHKEFGFLTGLLSASLSYIHGLSFIFSAIAILSFIVFMLIFEKRKEFFKKTLFLIIPLSLFIPYYFFILGKNPRTMFLFEPFAGLIFNYIKVFGLLLIILPFSIYKAIKPNKKEPLIFFSILLTLFAFVNVFVMPRGDAIDRYVTYMIFPILLLTLPTINEIKKDLMKGLVLILIVLFFAPNFILQLDKPISEKPFYKYDEYFVSEWLRNNSGENENFLFSPFGGTFYTAFTKKNAVLCEPFVYSCFFYDTKDRFSDYILMYIYPSKDIFGKYNMTYVVLGTREAKFFDDYDLTPYNFGNSSAFKKIFTHGNYTVFKLVSKQNLPDINKYSKSDLNFTSYSRWWEQ